WTPRRLATMGATCESTFQTEASDAYPSKGQCYVNSSAEADWGHGCYSRRAVPVRMLLRPRLLSYSFSVPLSGVPGQPQPNLPLSARALSPIGSMIHSPAVDSRLPESNAVATRLSLSGACPFFRC